MFSSRQKGHLTDFCHITGSHRRPPPSSQAVTMIGGARPVRTEIKRLKTNTRVEKEHLRILLGTSDAKIWCFPLLVLALQKFPNLDTALRKGAGLL